jgi:CRISPR system Cascade subunit CasD
LGAALGVPREDEEGQQQLSDAFRFGIKLAAIGTPLRDYHTAQVPPQKGKLIYRTRKQELTGPHRLETILSSREYRCDSLAIVAAEALPHAVWALEQVRQALRQPHFTLYLGRKSCVLGLPLAPSVMQAASLREALDANQVSLATLSSNRKKLPEAAELIENRPETHWPSNADRALFRPGAPRYFWEQGMVSGMDADLEQIRHDQPLSRRRWQFAPRREWVHLSPREEKAVRPVAASATAPTTDQEAK